MPALLGLLLRCTKILTKVKGQRWLLTDLSGVRLVGWGGELDIMEAMFERIQKIQKTGTKAMPRPSEALGKAVMFIEFRQAIGVWPRLTAFKAGYAL